ncbi:NUDIX domain-containing protein [Paenibacillus sp. MER TA 81-3]|nr:NUDIX domain-containing protein [Paenibacillus sp. MER TA 81-3]
MLSLESGQNTFNVRVSGILIVDNHLLLQQHDGGDYWYLPGGRVEMFETSEEALRREFIEETGITITSAKLQWIVEEMYAIGDRQMHEIGMYYCIDTIDHDDRLMETSQEAGYINDWIELDRLDACKIVPALKDTFSCADFESHLTLIKPNSVLTGL